MPHSRPASKAYAMLALVMLLWAGNSLVGRAMRDDIPPFTLSFVRWLLACTLLLPLVFRQFRADLPAMLRQWPVVVALGVIGVAGFNGFLYKGLHYTTATNGLLMQAAIPALVLLIDRMIFRVRPSGWQLSGVMLSTLGVALIVFKADVAAITQLQFGEGDVLVLCGVVGWAVYTALLRLRPAVAQASLLAATFIIGALTMTPFALTEWQAAQQIVWTPSVFGAFIYVAIFPSVIAYFLYNRAVAEIGPGRAGQAISLMPLFGALLPTFVLHEPLHRYHLIGMALILGGVGVTIFGARRGGPAQA